MNILNMPDCLIWKGITPLNEYLFKGNDIFTRTMVTQIVLAFLMLTFNH